MKRFVVVVLVGLLGAASLNACGEEQEQGCTEVGCDSGLSVLFVTSDGNALEGLSGQLITNIDVIEFDCRQGGDQNGVECLAGEILFPVTPNNATLELRDAADQVVITEEFSGIEYALFEPNGPSCEPTCLKATQTVTLEDTDGDGLFDEGDNCPADANPIQADFDEDGRGDVCDEPPTFRFVRLEDNLSTEPGDTLPGPEIDAVGLVRGGEEFFATSFFEAGISDCGDGNIACSYLGLLGAPNAVDNQGCFGGAPEDEIDPTRVTALDGRSLQLAFGQMDIRNGDIIRIYELGEESCGRFESEPVTVLIGGDGGDVLLGDTTGELVVEGLPTP